MSQSNYLKNIIKNLTPIDVFDYYDGPRFYSCQDKFSQVFLVYWIDEAEDHDSWLYLRVSQERYLSLKNGLLSVAEVLKNPEENCAFIVKNYSNDFSVMEIGTKEIEKEFETLDKALRFLRAY